MVKEQTVDGQANLQATTNLTPAQSLCKHFGKSIYSTSLALTVLMPSLRWLKMLTLTTSGNDWGVTSSASFIPNTSFHRCQT